MNIMRPVAQNDLDQLHRLAERVSPGMTTFPPNRDVIGEKIASSLMSFSPESAGDNYFMVLEETESGRILGTSAVYANIGTAIPFYSFAMLTRTQHSYELDIRTASRTLHLVNEYAGDTEVGTLILDPDMRGHGLGKLLSKSRYLLLAQFRELFGQRVMAELRGWSDANEISPFWEHVGKVFFKGLSYKQADYLSATTNNQFISDLMPEYPIYVDLLPENAQAVIGKPHDQGWPALRMLYEEGFRYENIVDIFDGGPTVHARVEDIETVKSSLLGKVSAVATPELNAHRCIACNSSLKNFRVVEIVLGVDANADIVIDSDSAAALQLEPGNELRYYPLGGAR